VLLQGIMGALLVTSVALEPVDAQPSAACADPIVDPSAPIRARVGSQFAVAFESNPTTGFRWSITTEPDPAVISLVRTEDVPALTRLPGAPGIACFVFAAVGAGSTSVDFAYARSFEAGVPPSTTANIEVIVTSAAQVPVQLPAR
jgi:predicted secreted protein